MTRTWPTATFVALLTTAVALAWSAPVGAQAVAAATGGGAVAEVQFVRTLGLPGGLCVQVGAGDAALSLALARSGRFLVHVVDDSAAAVAEARGRLTALGEYGPVSVERRRAGDALPYTENLVNLIVVTRRPGADAAAAAKEMHRVLCPNGVVLAKADAMSADQFKAMGLVDVKEVADQSGNRWLTGRKPWPKEMDQWTHARHGADGNAVSNDTIVGPPRRVRWVAGPWQEVSSMVTVNGRNFYGGVLARDGFNGLRLWDRPLSPSPARGGFGFGGPGGVPVVGSGDLLIVFDHNQLQAIDARTGKTVRAFQGAGKPYDAMITGRSLLSVTADAVACFDLDTGTQKWRFKATNPRYVVTGDNVVGVVQGDPRRGQHNVVLALAADTGKVIWQRSDLAWFNSIDRSVYHDGVLAYELSSFNNDGPGNALHLLSAADGSVVLDHPFFPGMNHMRQARAMFIGDRLWLLNGGRGADDKQHLPLRVSAIDFMTGKELQSFPAGLTHCFPPVATPKYMFSGEMNLTDLKTGQVVANHITKAACGRDSGWVPANGLIYVTPKHCVCWPMLRGYAALAPARPGGNPANRPVKELSFPIERGEAKPPTNPTTSDGAEDWPIYRHDASRSSSTHADGPDALADVWTARLGAAEATGPLAQDWSEDPFDKGPVTPPVVAGGLVVVARPDAHEVVALDAGTGAVRWRFTADGRVDTPPTLHRGLCLFGAHSGHVYCLRADNGKLIWRRRVAPLDERIVAYGQIESPWPSPGSVLVIDDVAYFAAGRQPLADGGILVFAADPATGELHWVQRLNSVPQKGFYESSGLEFDNFDLLVSDGAAVAMSRWSFDRQSGQMDVQRWNVFARHESAGGAVWAPRGCWTYAPRNQSRTKSYDPLRPLVVYRDHTLVGCAEDRLSLYRRDFDENSMKAFNAKWITGWAGSKGSQTPQGLAWPSQRLAEGATWKKNVNEPKPATTDANAKAAPRSAKVIALALAGRTLYLALADGRLQARSLADGRLIGDRATPAPVWDGLCIAGGRLFLSTADGRVMCIGRP